MPGELKDDVQRGGVAEHDEEDAHRGFSIALFTE